MWHHERIVGDMSEKKDIHQCLSGIVYNGEFNFTETVKVVKGEQYRLWLSEHQQAGKLPSHDRVCMPRQVETEHKICTVPEVLNIMNNAIACGHGSLHIKIKSEPKKQ